MSWLLWREYRRNRWILAAGAAGVLLPIIIAMVFNLNGSSGFIYPFFLSCVFSQMTVALLGANAVAGERSDRSDEFMRRSNTLASKQFFPVITVVAACIVYLWGGDQVALQSPMERIPSLVEFLSGLLVAYSFAWLLTSYLSSVAVVSCIGFVAPLLLLLPLIVSVEIGDGPRLHEMGRKDYIALASLNAMICLAVAAVCFSVATWSHFRSSES